MIHLFASITHNAFSYNFGSFQFTGFGIAVLAAFVIGQIASQHELWRRGHDPEQMSDLVFAAVIGGLLGAKIYYAVLMKDPGALLSRAGFVYWGGLMGGIVAVLLVARIKKLNLWRICDVGGIAVAAAYAVGRTGCWVVGDDYGRPWDNALAVKFPNGAPPSTVENMTRLFGTNFPAGTNPLDVVAVYPTQLFEVTMGFIMFAILWRMRDHKHAEGWLFGVYCVLAGIERFIVEFFRAKDDRFFGPFTTAQMIAIGFMLLGVIIMMVRQRVTERASSIYAAT
jgi:phosphatidylglycerol---prolipoprotein diacylglyceryl transferase